MDKGFYTMRITDGYHPFPNVKRIKKKIVRLRGQLAGLTPENWKQLSPAILRKLGIQYNKWMAAAGKENVPTRLELWHFTMRGDLYTAPELHDPAFAGWVFGHKNQDPRHKVRNARPATTSRVVDYDPEAGVFITSSGSLYQLGVVNPEYGKQFPNAKQRMIETALRVHA